MHTLYTLPVYSTRYVAPTSTRGARIRVASPRGQSVAYPWNHAAGETENHAAAAAALAAETTGHPAELLRLCGGCTSDGCFSFTVEKIGE